MTLSRDLAIRHAWRGALLAAVLNAVGMPIDYLIGRGIPGMPLYPSLMSSLVGIGLIVLLLIRRSRATVRLGSIAFLINTAAVLMGLWITSGYWASTGQSWTPFQANKLGALAAAMLAPELSVGLISITGHAAMAIGKYYALDPEIQRGLAVGEPWIVLIFAVSGGVLLAYRLRSMALEREMLRLHAEAEAAEQLARSLLVLRDYANTPIQTISFSIELIRASNPELSPVLVRLERAVERLTGLSRALTRYESAHKWSPGDESLDTANLAEQLLGGGPRITD